MNNKMNKWECVTEVKEENLSLYKMQPEQTEQNGQEQDTAKEKKVNKIMEQITQYTLRDMTKVFESIYSGEEIANLMEQETDSEKLLDKLKEREVKLVEQIYQKGFMMCFEVFNKA